ncbi:MAG: hypothetical protein GX282_01615 [Campylobacteraceae bacterium]|nr:hypothetical protein [Campylobacteraceae bacterium]
MNNKWISTTAFFAFGFMIYLFYFWDSIPFVSGQEFIYVITASAAIFLLAPIFVLAFLWGIWIIYDDDKQKDRFKKGWLFYKTFSVKLLAFILSIIFIIIFDKQINMLIVKLNIEKEIILILLVLVFLVGVFFIFAILVLLAIKYSKFASIIFMVLLPFIVFYPFVISIKMGNVNLYPSIVAMFMGLLFFWTVFIASDASKKTVYNYDTYIFCDFNSRTYRDFF